MRLRGWEAILADQIEAARERPFSWGEHDCATFAFNVRAAITGVDDAAIWRGRYKTELGGARFMKRNGWATLEQGANEVLGPALPAVLLAQRGDIVLTISTNGQSLGVCCGGKAAFVDQDGLKFWPLKDCARAWRV